LNRGLGKAAAPLDDARGNGDDDPYENPGKGSCLGRQFAHEYPLDFAR
jgi:hypothetical protein